MTRLATGYYSETYGGVTLEVCQREGVGGWYFLCNGGKFGDNITPIGGDDIFDTKAAAQLSGRHFIDNCKYDATYGWVS